MLQKGVIIMDKKVAELINEQINKELYSAYLYLEFANYYASVGLDGFENWYKIQAQEERDHALLFLQYLQNNDEKIVLEAVPCCMSCRRSLSARARRCEVEDGALYACRLHD